MGVGGAFLVVPVLMWVYHFTPMQAAGSSLFAVFLNGLSGSVSYLRQHRVEVKAGLFMAIATLPGSIVGAFIVRRVDAHLFAILFGILQLSIALYMIWRQRHPPVASDADKEHRPPTHWYQVGHTVAYQGTTHWLSYDLRWPMVIGLGIGFISSLFGIGGGVINVPVLVGLVGLPMHFATATSTFILSINSFFGLGTHLALGHVVWQTAIPLGIGMIGGAQLGAALSKRLSGAWITWIFVGILMVLGIREFIP